MKRCALYRLVNTATLETYIGISVDPRSRWKDHRKRARKGHGSKLYELIRRYGAERFSFSVVAWFESEAEARAAELKVIEWGLADLNMRKG